MTRPQSTGSGTEVDAVKRAVTSLSLCTADTATALRRLLQIDDPIHRTATATATTTAKTATATATAKTATATATAKTETRSSATKSATNKVATAKAPSNHAIVRAATAKASSKIAAVRTATRGTRATKSKPANISKTIPKHDEPLLLDHSTVLTALEKQKLATHVVNCTLRLLSESLVPSPPPKLTLIHVAECSRIAFAYLRATAVEKPASLTILSGVSSLLARLIAHGMELMASEELHRMKAYLEQQDESPPSQHTSSPTMDPSELTFCVKLKSPPPELLHLVIRFHSHLLSLLLKFKRPAVIEAVVHSLDPSDPSSPCAIVLESSLSDQGTEQAIKLLETQARTISSLCQHTEAGDEPSLKPETVFRLQIITLELRSSWWPLAAHRPDLDQELYRPLSRALDLYTSKSSQSAEQKYHLARSLVEPLLTKFDSRIKVPSVTMYKVYRSLSSIAQAASMTTESLEILQPLLESGHKTSNDRRIIAACAGMRSLALRIGSKDQMLHSLEPVVESIEDTIADLTDLLGNIATFHTEQAALRQVSAFVLSRTIKDKGTAVPIPDLQLIARLIFLSVETQVLVLNNTNAAGSTIMIGAESVRELVMKSSSHVINSTLMACRSIFQAKGQPPANMASALKHCCVLAEGVANDLGELHYVNLSNIYWLWFQGMDTNELLTHDSLELLRNSVSLLRQRPLEEQQAGFLAVKLEKLASILEMSSCHSDALACCAEALDLRLSCGSFSDLSALACTRPLRSAAYAEQLRPLVRALRVYQRLALHQALDPCAYVGDYNDSTRLAALIEIQMYMLEKDQHSIADDTRSVQIQKLAKRLLSLLVPSRHSIRIASCYTCVLRLEKEAPNSFIPEFLDEARAYKLDVGETSVDQELAVFSDYADASLQLSQMLLHTRPSLQVIKGVLRLFKKTIDSCTSYDDFQRKTDGADCLTVQLKTLHEFMSLKSHDEGCQEALQLLMRIHELERPLNVEATVGLITQLAAVQLRLGALGLAQVTLDRAKLLGKLSPLDDIRIRLSTCHALLTTGDIAALDMAANEAAGLFERLVPSIHAERDTTAWLRADLTFILSSLHQLRGSTHIAYMHAKNSVRITRAILSSRQSKAMGHDESNKSSLDVVTLTEEVGKLSMSGTFAASSSSQAIVQSSQHSTIWPALSLHLRGLQHLYNLCQHIGSRAEADYLADQARYLGSCVECGASNIQVAAMKAQHAIALGIPPTTPDILSTFDLEAAGNPLEVARLYLIQAEAYAKCRSWSKSVHSFEAADNVLLTLLKSMSHSQQGSQGKTLLSPGHSRKSEIKAKTKALSRKQHTLRKTPASQTINACTKHKPPTRQTERDACFDSSSADIAPIVNLRAMGLIHKASSLISQGHGLEAAGILEQTRRIALQTQTKMNQNIAEARLSMLRSLENVAMDFTFNVLPESTLSFPALSSVARRKSHGDETCMPLLSSPSQATLKSAPPKNGGRKKHLPRDFAASLSEARDQILALQSKAAQSEAMPVCYRVCEMALRSTVLLSAIDMDGSVARLHPTRAALSMEFPRIESIRRELSVLMVEASDKHDALVSTKSEAMRATLAATRFQRDYIDIIPETWAAVSLSMSEDCSELYIVRYQARRSPFLLRLPLVRNKLQDMDEEEDKFDYQEGYHELREIIELSNFSCHNNAKSSTPSDRAAWWEEREALDRRLQELLFNIESIWLGGFRGILSQHRRDAELLARFRKSFETILDRHLPSRQGSKSHTKPLLLDSNVLQLFIGLGYGQDGETDVDEQLLDLLYFVVDVLQFNGEHNAYDEIDFDSIATETLDALQSYHETANADVSPEKGHLVLILEKRLHAFPWESLPCLEGKSVSRVGSMLTLRERILVMHKQAGTINGARYMVNKSSGTYILNPSTDLTRTQDRLEPLLKSMQEKRESQWTAIVNHPPSESEFKDALTTSSVCLYFGHGSGDQYIRTRSIRKLNKCSEVVWLMGCSSGIVAENGEFEPTSVPMAYLVAGDHSRVGASYGGEKDAEEVGRDGLCMAIVATLWDVTDGDIDRFSARAGEEWGLWSTSQRKEKVATRGAPKTPGKKIRGTLKTPLKTPGREDRPVSKDGEKQSLVQAVVKAREACHLRYLNGAAAVVYGVPVYLDG